MATKVLVPLLGEGVEEVTVTKWLKKEGDSVRELEPLLEVNTDKVDTEIPAPASNRICSAGDCVSCSTVRTPDLSMRVSSPCDNQQTQPDLLCSSRLTRLPATTPDCCQSAAHLTEGSPWTSS